MAAVLTGCGGGNDDVAPAAQGRTLATVTSSAQVFPGPRGDYALTRSATGYLVTDLVRGGAGVAVGPDARLRFADMSLALDSAGKAGQMYRLYQAAFARTPDQAGLGYWLDAVDRGQPLEAIADGFVRSAEYRGVYGSNPTSGQIVARYYQNVLGRAGEAAGVAYWTGLLERGAASPAGVLAGFSESAENKAMVAGAIAAGVGYREPGVDYAPLADAGDKRFAVPNVVLVLDGSRSQAMPGGSLSYAWKLESQPKGSKVSLVLANTARPGFTVDRPGTYELSLTVSDGERTSAVTRLTVDALWAPSEARLPASGNFIYLESDQMDFVARGEQYLYTGADAVLEVRAEGNHFRIDTKGDQWWMGNFIGREDQARLQPGLYANLTRWPFHDKAKGGLDWEGEGRGCNVLSGWFVVDSVSYDRDQLVAIDLRFEQHCENQERALRGRVRWSASAAPVVTQPLPVPAGLWEPRPGLTPATGNYVYLEGSPGDFVSYGQDYLFTDANYALRLDAEGAVVIANAFAYHSWHFEFAGMRSLTRVTPGYYPLVRRYRAHNTMRGGMDVGGEGRGCNELVGWFAVDRAVYEQDKLTELDLRFEQNCEMGVWPLRGKLHWRAADQKP